MLKAQLRKQHTGEFQMTAACLQLPAVPAIEGKSNMKHSSSKVIGSILNDQLQTLKTQNRKKPNVFSEGNSYGVLK